MHRNLKAALIAGAWMIAGPAAAQTYSFTLAGDYSASWTMSARPTPDVSIPGLGFIVNDVRGSFGGIAGGRADIDFYTLAEGGGLEIDDPARGDVATLITSGAQLYGGTEDAPRLLLGPFTLTQYNGTGRYSLLIADTAAAPVPEPSAWLTMIAGFGLLGGMMRRVARGRRPIRIGAGTTE